MDEGELGKLFRDAAGTPPPASFDRDDVLSASRRATARRRSALAGGSLLGVAVLGGVLGAQLSGPAQPTAPADPPSAAAPAPEAGGRAAPQPLSTPGDSSGRSAAAVASCGPADPELAAELSAALADLTAPTGPPVPLSEPCPAQSRAAGQPVPGGTIYLVVSPAATAPGTSGAVGPDGARSHAVTTDDGSLVAVRSVPETGRGPAPLDEHVDELAREIAGRL